MSPVDPPPSWKQRGERAPRRGEAQRAFEPEGYGDSLAKLLRALDDWHLAHPGEPLGEAGLHRLLRQYPRHGAGFFSRSQLVRGLDHYGPALGLQTPRETLVRSLALRPTRSHSGIAPVTVFTRPHPCPGQCVFCPNDVRMPKSYLADEPGAQRAEDQRFDPYRQTLARLVVYQRLGHATDKVELIVLGGTWSSYPEAYRVWFITRCFDALNDFEAGCEAAEPDPDPVFLQLPRRLSGRALGESYNVRVRRALREAEQRGGRAGERGSLAQLEAAHEANERASTRCVGLSVETRPDHVSEAEVLSLRRLGVTKLQLGVQSLDDELLALNQRGHDSQVTRHAFALLRAAGFKIHAHFMPNLLGSDPARDRRDFSRLFDDPGFRPDELKVYPCSLVESAELMQHYERGAFRPYDDAQLLSVVEHALAHTPRYCRLTRVIRDISSDDIVAGNRRTNLREVAARRLSSRGVRGVDIRAREVRGQTVEPSSLRLAQTSYDAGPGEEVFLELVTPRDRVAAFLRLYLPKAPSFLAELGEAALLRELHVYGRALRLGAAGEGAAQHQGLGRSLVRHAARLAQARGYTRLSVISAVGTRAYYARLGFARGALYQHLALGRPGEAGRGEEPTG